MDELEDFRVQTNSLTGDIPGSLYQCTQLARIDVFENAFTGGNITSGIGQLVKLNNLVVHDNNLGGFLPSELGLVATLLSTIVVSGNNFSGSIPSEVCTLRDPLNLKVHEADCAAPREAVSLRSSVNIARYAGTPAATTVSPS